MITFCPDITDQHADFPHRLVQPVTIEFGKIKGVKGYQRTTRMSGPYVICAACDHWIDRPVPSCQCPVGCHSVVC